MNQKIRGFLATCLTAAVLLVLAMGVFPGTVNAATVSDPVLQINQNLALDIVDSALTQEQKASYIKIKQFQLNWQQRQVSRTVSETEEATSDVILEPATLEVSQVELDSIWHCPLALDTYVSSPFGMRLHPVYGYYKMHNGVDLDSDRGDDVLAARGGTVAEVGYSSTAGKYVKIDHGDGFITVYYHLSRQLVKEGQKVSGGELIGRVGNTGVSTGAHLHFGIQFEGKYVDPEDYIDF